MKILLLILSFVSISIFSMDPLEKNSVKEKQKRPLELVKEFLALPNGQLRTQYGTDQLCFETKNGLAKVESCISLPKVVTSGLTNIYVEGSVFLPNNVVLTILLATAHGSCDSVLLCLTKLPECEGNSARCCLGVNGDKVNIIDVTVFGIENSRNLLIKAFSKVGKNCEKYNLNLEIDESNRIKNVLSSKKNYSLQPVSKP